MFEKFRLSRKNAYIVLTVTVTFIGSLAAYLLHDQALDLGDSSTFYSFAENLASGEAIYKDFIHFRTPGSYFLFALFIKLFGEQQASVNLALQFELYVLYPLTFLVAAIIFYRQQRRAAWYVVASLAGLALIPPIAQLRAGFALLAVVCYIAIWQTQKLDKRWLLAAGIFTGISFGFGQETALMALVVIAAGELVRWPGLKAFLERLKYLAGGAVLGVLPLLLYTAIFSNLGNFLYYVTYYSFVLQPAGMNTPFPPFDLDFFIYYMPFFLYGLCFLVLFVHRTFGKAEALLLSFGIVRLITMLGRVDIGHLLFSISEIFIIMPWFLPNIRQVDMTRRRVRAFIPYLVGYIILCWLAMRVSSAFLAAMPFLIVLAVTRRPAPSKQKISEWTTLNSYLALGATFAIMVFMLLPLFRSTLKSLKHEATTHGMAADRVSGVKVDPDTKHVIEAITAAVEPLNPRTIFSFPIQAYFYKLAPEHGARYMTFEPQTTNAEQDAAIEDLKRTKPEVIIFDPMQAESLSASVGKISNYITSNYITKQEVVNRHMLWVMVPKESAAREEKLIYQVYEKNTNAQVKGIQYLDMGLRDTLIQYAQQTHYEFDTAGGGYVELAVTRNEAIENNRLSDCGLVSIKYEDGSMDSSQVCVANAEIRLPFSADRGRAQLTLEREGELPIVWNDPEIVGLE